MFSFLFKFFLSNARARDEMCICRICLRRRACDAMVMGMRIWRYGMGFYGSRGHICFQSSDWADGGGIGEGGLVRGVVVIRGFASCRYVSLEGLRFMMRVGLGNVCVGGRLGDWGMC